MNFNFSCLVLQFAGGNELDSESLDLNLSKKEGSLHLNVSNGMFQLKTLKRVSANLETFQTVKQSVRLI